MMLSPQFPRPFVAPSRSSISHDYKLKDLGITGKLGVWFFHFLSNRSHFVRLPGGVSNDHPVIIYFIEYHTQWYTNND